MKRKNKIVLGTTAIIFVFISALIGLWLLSDTGESYAFAARFVLRFCLIATPVITVQAVFSLLKGDK